MTGSGTTYGPRRGALRHFLPNGDALFSYEPFNSSALHLVYRFANGTFGPVFSGTSALSALAIRSGEVLVVENPGARIPSSRSTRCRSASTAD